MSFNGQSVLAVVPARGGSKGIPGKNLCRVGDRSLIGHAAHLIGDLPWLDAAVLSTDDEAIAAEGRRVGLDVPFLRPAELATDEASSVGAWRHAWLECERLHARRFDVSILLQPTTPLRDAADIARTVAAVVDGGHRAATTVSRVPGHFVPEKLLRIDERGVVQPITAAAERVSRRQAAPGYYWRNGACYCVRRDTLVDDGRIVEDDCAGILIEDVMVNIDDPFELEFAEFLIERRRSDGGEETRDA